MSWKPSRSSGIMFERYTAKSNKYRQIVGEMIERNEHIRFENFVKFSRAVYLYWKNENAAFNALCSSQGVVRYSLEACCLFTHIYDMLKRYPDKVYKPLQQHLI